MGYGPNFGNVKTSNSLPLTERVIYHLDYAVFMGNRIEMTESGIRKHYEQFGFEVLKVEHDPYLQQLHVDVRRPDHPQIMKFGFHVGDLEFGATSACRHEFKEYHGFTESYRYCIKCDHKEDV